ncbi:hypothetical protein C2G38_2246287 [Gigaspora rosea]|uniref:Uncharacterized protein n=1 Tax=Gigaspora rosea TaxID=44941 RepID=A0A397V8D5_9GLOM|nr:hypothetical protein C2G38_2246287 [Gigaspora rosea]
MKALSYDLVPTVITITLLTILPIGYTKDITFSYTETSAQDNLTNTQPRVWDIKHYQDNTAVLRISRDNYFIGNTTRCFEQKLMLRVIQTNGSVIPINLDIIEEIQDINYCLVNDKRMIIDWNGYNISKIEFGPSYLLPGTNIWIPNDYLTVNPWIGFLRLSMIRGTNNFIWSQYAYYGDGLFSLLRNDTVENLDLTNIQVSVLPTLNYGYAIIYTNTNRNTADPLSKSGGLYVMFLNYNQTTTSQPFVLYEKSTQNVVFTRLACSIDYSHISYECVLIMEQEDPASINGINNTITSCIKIRFLSTGSRLKLDSIFNLTLTSFNTLPLGGYILISQKTALNSTVNFTVLLYDENSKPWEFLQQPIISNLASSYDILPNNTMLVSQNETTTTWNLLAINLPQLGPFNDSGYGNLHVNSTYPSKGSNDLSLNFNMIHIIYQEPVSLSDGYLTIYQIINRKNVLRQIINSKTCQCNISVTVIKINILSCTFNYPGGKYFIQIDNNFVKTESNEPLLGIQPNIWTFETANKSIGQNRSDTAYGILRLTTKGTQYFLELSDSKRHLFFDDLIKELTVMIPIEEGMLSSNEHYQLDPDDVTKFFISISIKETKDSDNMTTSEIKTNLDQLIKNKAYTGI